MDNIRISVDLTTDDWRALQRAFVERRRKLTSWWKLFLASAGPALIAVLVAVIVLSAGHPPAPWIVFLCVGGSVALVGLTRRVAAETLLPDPKGAFIGACTYEFGADGMHTAREGLTASCAWNRIQDIHSTSEHVFLWLDRFSAYIVPLRHLPADLTPAEFEGYLRRHGELTDEGRAKMATKPPTGLASPGLPEVAVGSGYGWLKATLRLVTLRRPANLDSVLSDLNVTGLGLTVLAIWAALDRIQAGAGARFAIYNIPELGLPTLMILLLAFAMSRASRPKIRYRSALFAVFAILPLLLLSSALIDAYVMPRWSGLLTLLMALYALIYIARSLSTLTGSAQFRAVSAVLLLLFAYGWLNRTIYLTTSLWMQAESPEDSDATASPAVAEPLLFDQRSRLDAALNSVAPSGAESPAAFFVGFAGVARQKVFAEEIKFAAKVVAQRYDTASRQLLLINDRRDLESYPLATVSDLRYALQGIAKKMNLNKDVLFLSLSSHGSARPLLSVSNGSLGLQQVTGQNLAAALRDSGIKWRVIVISACYAGAFIDALKDPRTVIITAASATRTSFGCSDDRDLTYFGEAFYRDALGNSGSLRQAFTLATTEIAKREKKEGVTPSAPQAFFGSEIEPVLDAWSKVPYATRLIPRTLRPTQADIDPRNDQL